MQLIRILLGLAILSVISQGVISCDEDEVDRMIQTEEEEEEEEDVIPEFHPTADWMQSLIYEFPEREIRLLDICLPRSHDGGTYILQNCSAGANACNTQTQHQDTYNQLMDGVRNFDVRPVLRNNVYFTQHRTACDGLGCFGDRVENMLEQLKRFLDEHNELVVIEFGHWCSTGPEDEDFRTMVATTLGNRLYRETGAHTVPFIQRALAEILPTERETGIAIMTYEGAADNSINRESGIFSPSFIPRGGSYANAQQFEDMKDDQFNKYAAYPNNGSSLFEFSWTLTMDTELAVACAFPWTGPRSIRSMAEEANSQLTAGMDELIANGQITSGRIPNVISVDFCETFVTEECLRISRLNLEE